MKAKKLDMRNNKKHHIMSNRFTPILIIVSAFWLFGLTANAQNGPTIGGSVYGGGNKAAVTGTVTVDISAGEVKKNVFGGGNEAGINNHNEQTDGTATVTVANATVGSAEGSYGIYGGCNTNGTVASDVEVRIKNGSNFGTSTKPLKGIYGGGFGAATATGDDVTVTIGYENTTPTVYGDVYGGSALGKVNDASATNPNLTKVDVKGGTVNGTVYGGGMGDGTTAALVNGNVEVAVNGNVTQGVYGGCNVNGIVKGGSTVGITAGTIGHVGDYGAAYGGGLGENTKVKGNVIVNVNGASASITGDVYGGSAQGLVNCNDSGNGVNGSANTQVTLANGTITGNLYGGGHGLDNKAANVWGPVTVNVNGGSVANVFGCNNLNGAPQSTVQVDVDETTANTMTVSNVYGGGNVAAYGGTPAVNIKAGTVSGNVYGGGNNITSDSQTNPAGVLGSNVEMTGGTVLGSIYGGCNQKGTVTSNSVVNIVGGIIGSQNLLNAGTVSQVFGGGLGESTNVNGNVTVTISKASGDNAPAAPTIYGDVYGGSALGMVNDAASDETTVHILDGTLVSKTGMDANGFTTYTGGNVFGGGLGESGPDNVNKGKVNGKVEVNIGSFTANAVPNTEGDHTGNSYSGSAVIGGCVYGCNNTNGSPQDMVTVNVYQTAHTDGTGGTPNNTVDGNAYAIANVFGGGNLANYTATGKKATVNVFSCDNTIGRTFGGGNAAATPNVETQIKGGRIGQVFGGGNGEVSAANINGTVLLGTLLAA